MMMANTFTNPDVIDYLNANYYPVKFDAESADPVTFQGNTYTNPNYVPNKPGRNGVHQFSQAMGVRAYPTLVFLDEKAAVIAPISGYKTPPQLELYLRFFEDAYTPSVEQSDWEAYQNAFQPSW
jgi:thioredoxin-related protein